MGSWESGCVHVRSGRTQEVLLGIWGLPYTRDGLGMQVLGLPDVSGDGLADVLVVGAERAHAFAGRAPLGDGRAGWTGAPPGD